MDGVRRFRDQLCATREAAITLETGLLAHITPISTHFPLIIQSMDDLSTGVVHALQKGRAVTSNMGMFRTLHSILGRFEAQASGWINSP